ASQEPRWGTATLSRSCACAAVHATPIMARVQSAPTNVALAIISILPLQQRLLVATVHERRAAQIMACRTLADTHSLNTTVAMMTSRMSDTCVHARVVIAALRGGPMPPAPTSPRTVDSRMLISHRNTEIPAKAGITCGTMP